MNIEELRAEMARKNMSIPKLAKSIGIGRKAMYQKMTRETEFKQSEIFKISKVLELSDEKIMSIFFAT